MKFAICRFSQFGSFFFLFAKPDTAIDFYIVCSGFQVNLTLLHGNHVNIYICIKTSYMRIKHTDFADNFGINFQRDDILFKLSILNEIFEVIYKCNTFSI